MSDSARALSWVTQVGDKKLQFANKPLQVLHRGDINAENFSFTLKFSQNVLFHHPQNFVFLEKNYPDTTKII